MNIIHRIAAACLLGLFAPAAIAQPTKTFRQQLIGTWINCIRVTTPDGKKSFRLGEKPNGTLIFTEMDALSKFI